MSDKKLAEKHFGYLHDNWISDEQKHYEEYFIVEGADDIPTSKLDSFDITTTQSFSMEMVCTPLNNSPSPPNNNNIM